MNWTNEAAFETVIEAHLLANGYASVAGDGFDPEFEPIVLTHDDEGEVEVVAELVEVVGAMPSEGR